MCSKNYEIGNGTIIIRRKGFRKIVSYPHVFKKKILNIVHEHFDPAGIKRM